MSLVGSEVKISQSFSTEGTSPSSQRLDLILEEVDDLDQHPPPTPPRPAESLFFGSDLSQSTQTISAAALAQQLHEQYRASSVKSSTSQVTDYSDFCSAAGDSTTNGNLSQRDADDSKSTNTHNSTKLSFFADRSLFSRDTLGIFSRAPATPSSDDEDNFRDSSMSTSNDIDAAAFTYDTVKNVWGWGKDQAILKPFLGVAEAVAGKVVATALSKELSDVDTCVVDQLQGLDSKVLNPAIAKILEIIGPALENAGGFVQPIISAVTKPLIKDKPENPELTTSKPALTSAR